MAGQNKPMAQAGAQMQQGMEPQLKKLLEKFQSPFTPTQLPPNTPPKPSPPAPGGGSNAQLPGHRK